jgi:hypothetical protein
LDEIPPDRFDEDVSDVLNPDDSNFPKGEEADATPKDGAVEPAPNSGLEEAAPNNGAVDPVSNVEPAPNTGLEEAVPNDGAVDSVPNDGVDKFAPNTGVEEVAPNEDMTDPAALNAVLDEAAAPNPVADVVPNDEIKESAPNTGWDEGKLPNDGAAGPVPNDGAKLPEVAPFIVDESGEKAVSLAAGVFSVLLSPVESAVTPTENPLLSIDTPNEKSPDPIAPGASFGAALALSTSSSHPGFGVSHAGHALVSPDFRMEHTSHFQLSLST